MRRRIAGFSLIEALVALTMLGAGVLVVGAALSTTNRAARDSLDATVAEHLVGEKLERLRLEAYADLRDGEELLHLDGVDFRRAWSVRRDVPRAGMSAIQVEVAWSEYAAPLTRATSSDPSRAANDPIGTVRNVTGSSSRTRSRSITIYVADR